MSYKALDASRLSRAEAVARAIETEISSGHIFAGESLGTKDELKQRFGVAVATINEAMKLLGARGLIEARPGPGGGVFVRPVTHHHAGPMIMDFEWSAATMADYHEVRDALEPIIFRHAAEWHSDEDIAKLSEIVGRMETDLDDPPTYLKENSNFHRYIASISPNKPLRSLYVTVLDFFGGALDTDELPARLHRKNAEVHRELVEALSSRDPKRLRAAIRTHDRHRRAFGLAQPDSGRA
ncbi:MAG TPA: FCD domain-containing protein [Solirubrobacteraceae bacterium]|jgi:DNA-binding FadR family transcriptional regulator|nr:FCD domain-containing protein [Solirubrobacteraceae bacterium]